MSDLIDRQAAIDELYKCPNGTWTTLDVMNHLSNLPSAQPTLYGYKIEHLAMIARVMEKEGVSPEKAVETFQDIGGIVQMIADEQKEIIRKAVEQWLT